MLPAPLPRRLFEPLLEFQPRQLAPFGTQMFEIRKPDLRDQPRIGIGRRTAAGRHAVDHRLRGIGHGRDDESARAHAERVDPAAVFLVHERIGGRREVLAARLAMVLDRVDQRLRMLDAHPHGKGLGLDAHAAAVEQFVNIARRMARSQHDGGSFDQFVAAPYAFYPVAFDFQIGNAAPETEHAARSDNRLPDTLHDARQLVGSDVRMGLEENFGRRTVKHQRLQRLVVVAAFFAAGEELAVGKGPGSAFTEGVVRVGVHSAVAVDLRDVALAGRNVAPALQNHGPQAQFDQPQRREQPRRSRSHDHDLRASVDRRIVEMHRPGLRLAVDVHFERQVHLHLPLPGVDRPFHDPRQSNIGLRDTHAPRRLRGVKRRIGSLLRREYKGNMLRHV